MKKIFAAFALFVCIAFCSASAENFLSVKRQKKITPTTKINYDFTKLITTSRPDFCLTCLCPLINM